MQCVFQPAVYIMASQRNGTLYVGVTGNLPQRVWQHREGVVDGFTAKHGCKLLVWFEIRKRPTGTGGGGKCPFADVPPCS
jgi:predicted GIY-YIG superfamily endonuclease